MVYLFEKNVLVWFKNRRLSVFSGFKVIWNFMFFIFISSLKEILFFCMVMVLFCKLVKDVIEDFKEFGIIMVFVIVKYGLENLNIWFWLVEYFKFIMVLILFFCSVFVVW